MSKWFYPTYAECQWAQDVLAAKDRREHRWNQQWRQHGMISVREERTDRLGDLLEWYAVQYVETGNRAWLHLGTKQLEFHKDWVCRRD